MVLKSSSMWDLTDDEITILIQAAVAEEVEDYKNKFPEAVEIVKKAYKIQGREDKKTRDWINKQEPKVRNILLQIYEKEIK